MRRPALGLLLCLLVGCASERDSVPGNVQPGSIEAVTREIDGAGSDAAQGEDLRGIGVIPVTGHITPVIPLIRPPQVILFYVFPRTSRDGLSWRNGVWIARVTKPFSWGVDDAMREDRLKLSSLTNMRLDEHGQLVVDQATSLEPKPQDVDALRAMAMHLPWKPGSGTTTRTTIVNTSSGQSLSTTVPGTASPYITPSGSVNLQEVQRAMQEAQQRLRASQLQGPPPGATPAGGTGTGVPGATPVGGP